MSRVAVPDRAPVAFESPERRRARRRPRARDRGWWGRVALALASGLLLALAFPPVDLGPLALVALVPLLWTWRDARPRHAAFLGFVAGLGFFAVLLSWTWYFGAIAIVPLVAVEAAYWAGAGALVGFLGRLHLRSPWLVAAAWTLLEALRGRWPLGGLPWGEIGTALHSSSPARALASWGGVPLVSFAVVAVNALLSDALRAARSRRLRPLALAAGGLAVAVALTAAGDVFRFEPIPTGTLRFALLQGNDQDRYLSQEELDAHYLPESHFRLAARLRGHYDLIVFPESSLDADPRTDTAPLDDEPRSDPGLGARLAALARAHGAAILANANTAGPGNTLRNTNFLYGPDGRLQGTYAKQHLVPFGEYVPLRSVLGFVHQLQRVPNDFTPGHTDRLFRVADHRVATVICFESAFGPLVRGFVRRGAEIIVVSTNNRSYRRSANSAQHVALSEMRAAETARPVLHASISGITAVIDASGRVHRETRLFHNAVVTGRVTTERGETPYVRWGDWVLWGSLAATVGAVVVALLRRRLAGGSREG